MPKSLHRVTHDEGTSGVSRIGLICKSIQGLFSGALHHRYSGIACDYG
ncbi:MAG: hypothetical protein RG741_07745 [Bacteroidales bacterium]|nr:hypothetical protein [Bacteroidales bacterium]